MPTTTNYSWTTPADTDLVKDGASAIRTLGTAIDTTTKNLNPETTLGDISYRSSTANTNTRLALGTAGQVLKVNSGATAPEWATISTGGMTLISTTTLSGASTTLSSIPSTYNSLQIIVQNYKPATDSYLLLRINGDATASRHKSVSTFGLNSSTFDSGSFLVSNLADNTTAEGLISITIPDYANAVTRKIAFTFGNVNDGTTTTNQGSYIGMGVYNQIGAISSLVFLNEYGYNFTSGTVLLYGAK